MTITSGIYDGIVAVDQLFMSSFRQKDAQGIANLYTENGKFLAPNGDFVSGRKEIEKTFQHFMDMGICEIKLETLEVEGYGDTATEVGLYILESADGQMLDKGKFMVIWKKEHGNWRLYRDMINSSLPAPQ